MKTIMTIYNSFCLAKSILGQKVHAKLVKMLQKQVVVFFQFQDTQWDGTILFKFSNCFYNIFSQRALLLFLSICKFYIIVYFQNYN